MTNGAKEASGLDLLKRLRVRWPLAAGVFAGMFACIAAVVLTLPNKYEARLKVVVKNDRVDPMLGSDKQTQSILNVNDVSEPRINTEIQLLTSSQVLLEAVKQCRLSSLVGMKGKPDSLREEAALRQLRRDLVVTPVRNSNVIDVSYESTDARRSAEVVKAVWQAYNLANRKMHGVPGSLPFFERLSSKYDSQLAAAQAELSRFRRDHDVVSLPEEQALALTSAAHLRSQIADSAAEEQKNAAAASRLKQEIDTLPSSVERDRRSVPNHALAQQLTSLLVTLQNKRTELSQRYQPGDRLLTELDAEIARVETALGQAGRSPADEVSVAANPALDIARGEYIRTTAVGAGAQAQTNELARQMSRDRVRLSALTAEASTYKQLVQKVTELEELDQSYHKKTDEARFEKMLDEQQISNLALVDEPYTSALPSSPKRGLLLSVGFLWSVLIALVAAAAAEAFAASSRNEETSSTAATDTDATAQPIKEPVSVKSPMRTMFPAQSPMSHPAPGRSAISTSPASQRSSYRVPPQTPQIEGRNGASHSHADESFRGSNGNHVRQFVDVQAEASRVYAMNGAAGSPAVSERKTGASFIHSPSELLEAVDLPLLANVTTAASQPKSSSFSALYESVQRGDTSHRKEPRP